MASMRPAILVYGTAAGTSEITGISNAFPDNGAGGGGLFTSINPDFTVFNNEVLFVARDASKPR